MNATGVSRWSALKQFWFEEEVPRWLGLGLVFVFTAGLGGVAWTAASHSNCAHQGAALRATASSVGQLAYHLGSSLPDNEAAAQRALLQFAVAFPCEELRVVDGDRMVIASLNLQESAASGPAPAVPAIEGAEPTTIGGIEMLLFPPDDEGVERCFVRAPIRTAAADDGRTLAVEGIVSAPEGDLLYSGVPKATFLIMIASSTGLLFLYHRMRGHFRAASFIARAAKDASAEPEALADRLESLRVADSLGQCATLWNSLLDTIEDLRVEAQRSNASEELHQALRRSGGGELAAALNTLPNALLHVEDGGRVAYSNAMAGRLLLPGRGEDGEPRGELASGAILSEISASDLGERMIASIGQATRKDRTYDSHTEVIEDVDGSFYQLRVLPIGKRAGEASHAGCLVVISDVSQQVRADKAREDFVSQVTHELRTPLSNIRAYAETLASGLFDDPKVITDCYNVIMRETRRLSRLIEDILSISQMEAGSISVSMDDVDIRALVTDTVRDLRGLADEKGLDLQMMLPAKLGAVQADRDKLAVVLNNLVGNALKYTPEGGSVHVSCKLTEDEMTITVKDTGIGIDPADQERVFEKFQRANDEAVKEQVGTGIGLTTAREIVRRHGGDIELMSAKGEGSTFVVRIPVAAQLAMT